MRHLLDSSLARAVASLAMTTLVVAPLAGCGIGNGLLGPSQAQQLGETAAPPTQFGIVVADDPDAATIGRQILNQGGNAADAAVAMGFAMAVALPSRAGLGGGGACIVHTPNETTTIAFPAAAPATLGGDRPAAVPALARGLLAIEARYGSLDFPSVVAPSERLAAATPVSPALAADLAVVGPALLADPAAAAIFGTAKQGGFIHQPDLAITLATIRTQGVFGVTQGSFAHRFVQAADLAGGGLTQADLARTVPVFSTPRFIDDQGSQIAFLPTDGGAAAAAYRALMAGAVPAVPAGAIRPASAGFAALDKSGDVVVCVTSMNNLFGTGRIAPGTGIVLAAAPVAGATPLLSAGVALDGGVQAAASGTGQSEAPIAAATALFDAVHGVAAPIQRAVPEPGRANVIACPGGQDSCTATADPRGNGLALK